MTRCEICGRNEVIYKAIIEGSELKVCEICVRFGKIISRAETTQKPPILTKKPSQKKEISNNQPEEMIIANHGALIKRAREKLALSQEEFAKKINEKLSLVHKMETSTFIPSIELARKIERFLKIKIVEKHDENGEIPEKKDNAVLRIGDILKIGKS